MLSVLWRLLVLGLCVPFIGFPIINIVAIPVAVYMVISLVRLSRRRRDHSAPSY